MPTTFIATTLDRLRRTADKISFMGPTLARLTVGLCSSERDGESCTPFPM